MPISGIPQLVYYLGAQDLAEQLHTHGGATNSSAAVWPTASLAIFVPLYISFTTIAKAFTYIPTTQSGNIDMGLYQESGAKIVSTGSTAVAAAGAPATISIANTALGPGRYYLGIAIDNITAAIRRWQPNQIGVGARPGARSMGLQQMAAAFPLPTTVTLATPATAYIPHIGVKTTANPT